jgi:hypothetical protein
MAILLGISCKTEAQIIISDSTDTHISVIAGIGPNYGFQGQSSACESVQLRFSKGNLFITTRYMYSDLSNLPTIPDKTIEDIGAVVGYTYKKHLYNLSIGAGVSYGSYVNRGKYDSTAYYSPLQDVAYYHDELHSHSICVPLQADAFWTPSDVFELGISIFDNINSVENNYGFLFLIRINIL